MSPRQRTAVLAGTALAFLVLHLAVLPRTLDDIDSVNFALGIRDFDPTRHQPHPPGYPVFIAIARPAAAVADALGAGPAPAAAAVGMAALGAISGALAIVALFVMFRALEGLARPGRVSADGRALLAVGVTAACPLLWFQASRPMTDVTGLAFVAVAQALLALAYAAQRAARRAPAGPDRRSDRWLVAGAVASALAIGCRSQALWQTVPVLAFVIADRLLAPQALGRATRVSATAALAFVAAVLAWAVPLVAASGGPSAYLGVLGDQALEDAVGVEMLSTTFTRRLAALALWRTAVLPWSVPELGLAVVVLAGIGTIAFLRRGGAGVPFLAACALPYALFHLLFQETETLRYALPLVPVASYLAVTGAASAGRVAVATVALVVIAIGLGHTRPAQVRYCRDGSPLSRALKDLQASTGPAGSQPIALGHHHVFGRWLEVRDLPALRRVPAAPGLELQALGGYWRDGGETAYFLADPKRTDLVLVDPGSLRRRGRYSWTFDEYPLLLGTRPGKVDWYEMTAPGWFLDEGWALTPEIAGIATRDGRGPHVEPIVAWVRRRDAAANLVLGGRHLGAAGAPRLTMEVRLDGHSVDAWPQDPGSFLRTVRLAPGRLQGPSRFARLTVAAWGAPGEAPGPVGIEQFDVQTEGTPVVGFDEGWHELEHDRRRRRLFRWTSGAARLRLAGWRDDLTLVLDGESPLKYFPAAPRVVVRAGAEVLEERAPDRDFRFEVRVPAAALSRSGGQLTIETDRVFVPAERSESPDRRSLGLRLFDVRVVPAH